MNRLALRAWVAEQHKGQLVKKTEHPYLDHLLSVAQMAQSETLWGYEVGLCHDLFEKTNITPKKLNVVLNKFGYEAAADIVSQVNELTNVFTKINYPNLTKTQRKIQEDIRLIGISPAAQTVKYADLIYNIRWVLKYEPDQDYLERKERLLIAMNKGSNKLRTMAFELCKSRPVEGGF